MKVSRISLTYGGLAFAAAFFSGYASYQLLSLASYYNTVLGQVNGWCHKATPACTYAFSSGDMAQPEITLVYRGHVRADAADRARKELDSRDLLIVSGHPLQSAARPIGLRAEGR